MESVCERDLMESAHNEVYDYEELEPVATQEEQAEYDYEERASKMKTFKHRSLIHGIIPMVLREKGLTTESRYVMIFCV